MYEGGSDGLTLTFTSNWGWQNVNAYFFANNNPVGAVWPGTPMSFSYTNEMGQNVYTIQVPAGAQSVIFNNNAGSQTVDIPVPAEPTKYYISGGEGNALTVATWQ